MIVYIVNFSNGKRFYGFSTEKLNHRRSKHEIAADNDSPLTFHTMVRRFVNEDDATYTIIKDTQSIDEVRSVLMGKFVIEFNMPYNGIESPIDLEKVLFLDELASYFIKVKKRKILTPRQREKLIERKRSWAYANPLLKKQIDDKIRHTKIEMYKKGELFVPHDLGCAAAAQVNKGSLWFNDGYKDYRLKPQQGFIKGLYLGRLKFTLKRRIAGAAAEDS